eukprot:117810-Amphidinium_carterae.2
MSGVTTVGSCAFSQTHQSNTAHPAVKGVTAGEQRSTTEVKSNESTPSLEVERLGEFLATNGTGKD